MNAEIIKLNIEPSCEIELYFHCKECLEEKTDEVSAKEYQYIEAGWTRKGLQVWCKRHNKQIIHVDFEGSKHKLI